MSSGQAISSHASKFQIFRQKACFSHDALFNLHEIAFDLDGYVSKIVTYPDLLVILSELNRIISTGPQSPILLSYDTTFKLTCISPCTL